MFAHTATHCASAWFSEPMYWKSSGSLIYSPFALHLAWDCLDSKSMPSVIQNFRHLPAKTDSKRTKRLEPLFVDSERFFAFFYLHYRGACSIVQENQFPSKHWRKAERSWFKVQVECNSPSRHVGVYLWISIKLHVTFGMLQHFDYFWSIQSINPLKFTWIESFNERYTPNKDKEWALFRFVSGENWMKNIFQSIWKQRCCKTIFLHCLLSPPFDPQPIHPQQ